MDNVETVAAPQPEPLTPAQLKRQHALAYSEALSKGDHKEAHRLNTVHNLGFSDANVPNAL